MKILLTNHHLLNFTGSEIFTYTLADFLTRNGNDVTVYSKFIDKIGVLLKEKHISFVTNLRELQDEKFDIAHVHHLTNAIEVRNIFPKLPMIYLSHGVLPPLEQNPGLIVDLNISKFLAVSEEVEENLIKSGVSKNKIKIFRNIFDTSKFHIKKSIQDIPKRALIISARIGEKQESVIKKACEDLNIEHHFVGGKFGWKNQDEIADLIQKSEIVFTLGRGVVETMLSGRVPIIFDYLGGDGMITPFNYAESMKCNFSGRRYAIDYSVDNLKKEILKYQKDFGISLRNIAIKNFNAETNIKKLTEIYNDVANNNRSISVSEVNKRKAFILSEIISESINYHKEMFNKELEYFLENIEHTDNRKKKKIKEKYKLLDRLIIENRGLLRSVRDKDQAIRDLSTHLDIIKSSKLYRLWQYFKRIKNKCQIFSKKQKLSIATRYQHWLKENYPSRTHSIDQPYVNENKTKISVVIGCFNSSPADVKYCIDAIKDQIHNLWEAIIVCNEKDLDLIETVNKYSTENNQVKLKLALKNDDIIKSLNSALSAASSDYIAVLSSQTILWPNAFLEVAKYVDKFPHANLLYSDEDCLSNNNQHENPFFKPGWSPDLLRSINYIGDFFIARRDIITKVGGYRTGTEGAHNWDLLLRITYWLEKASGHSNPLDRKNPILHIPTILFSTRNTRITLPNQTYIPTQDHDFFASKRVLQDDLVRRGYEGDVLPAEKVRVWRIKYKLIDKPLVSIVIPTKNKYSYIKTCLNSIINKTTYRNYELVIVDTGSDDQRVWNLYEDIINHHTNTQVLKWEKEFNYSAVSNYGAENSKGDYLLLLNNDTAVITPDWIENLLEQAVQKDVGAVGCKLLFPDNRIQHAGVILGIKGGNIDKGIAGHAFYLEKDTYDFKRQSTIQKYTIKNYSAVTAACMLIKKSLYLKYKMDERFKIAFNDVELCLRLIKNNKRIIFTPFSVLYHHESVSVLKTNDPNRDYGQYNREIKKMLIKYGDILANDNYYNPNLNNYYADFNVR